MDYYAVAKEDFEKRSPHRFTVVPDLDALNLRCAQELADIIDANNARGNDTVAILPVGPLRYPIFARVFNDRKLDLSRFISLNMDEYLGPDGNLIPENHPLSFRAFMTNGLVASLDPARRFSLDNLRFPDPHAPEKTTAFIDRIGGADIVFGGFGITGHFAFNDPPEPDQPASIDAVAGSLTRVVTIARESQAQMAMGGTAGNTEILPKTAITIGMKEMRASKKVHLTFMRSWHAGLFRRALFGPKDPRFPGSLLQDHPNLEVTLTELAASLPLLNVAQAIADK